MAIYKIQLTTRISRKVATVRTEECLNRFNLYQIKLLTRKSNDHKLNTFELFRGLYFTLSPGEASLLQISTKGVKLHFFIGKQVKK